jgi:hypothetical protein
MRSGVPFWILATTSGMVKEYAVSFVLYNDLNTDIFIQLFYDTDKKSRGKGTVSNLLLGS